MKFGAGNRYGTNFIIDSIGQRFQMDPGPSVAEVFCPTGKNAIHRRIIQRYHLKNTSDTFGRSKKLPLFIGAINIYYNKVRPSLENVPSF